MWNCRFTKRKSTLFNCLSNAKAQSANYPFCTIEPNLGTVSVPDKRLFELEKLVNPERVLPAGRNCRYCRFGKRRF
jgi:ribosome-binding ATPase YchF (GTP1/OBG family)